MTHPHFIPTEEAETEVVTGGIGADSSPSLPLQPEIDSQNEKLLSERERQRAENQRDEEKLEAKQERERQESENTRERERQERENKEAIQAAQTREATTVAPASSHPVSRPEVISQKPQPITHGGRRG